MTVGKQYREEIERVMSTLLLNESGEVVGGTAISEIEREVYDQVVGKFVLSSLRGQLVGLR
jgi:hypothetical protein